MSASHSSELPVPSLWTPRVANALVALLAVAATLLLFEIGVRWFVDLDALGPIQVHDVDLEKRIAFLPGKERSYETPEFHYTIRTNRFGRRDREWTPAELADPRNLLFIGDSFVMGASVEDPSTIPTRLEARAAAHGEPREVFNFGMPATGIPQYVEILEDALGIGVQAHTVLLGIFIGNDFDPATLQPGYPQPAQAAAAAAAPRKQFEMRSKLLDFLKLRVSHSERLVGWVLQLDEWLGIRLYNTTGSHIFLRNPPPDKAESFDRILDSLGTFADICARNGRELYVVVFPNKIQIENRDSLSSSVYDALRPNRQIAEYCASKGLRCYDELPALAEAYEREKHPLYFPTDRHLNEDGTRVAAESLSAWLEGAGALESAPPLRPAAL